jgi:hypothetical protein
MAAMVSRYAKQIASGAGGGRRREKKQRADAVAMRASWCGNAAGRLWALPSFTKDAADIAGRE